jgi:hypothetical protein
MQIPLIGKAGERYGVNFFKLYIAPYRNSVMKIHFPTFLVAIILSLKTLAQEEPLFLRYNCLSSPHEFTKVLVLDNRANNQSLGFVQKGGFNRMAQVIYKGSLADSLSKFFLAADTTGKPVRELALLLYEFYLSENIVNSKETGSFRLSLRLFVKDDMEKYYEVLSIDSNYSFSSLDVTQKLLSSVSEHMCEISQMAGNWYNVNADRVPHFYRNELQALDSIEKKSLPVYNTAKINAGIYMDYEHFKNNAPDSSLVQIDTSDIRNIKVSKWSFEKRKYKPVDFRSVYAVRDGNTVVKATSMGFYKLQKINYDFYFTGQTSFSNANNVAMWGAAFGLAGMAIASESERNTALFFFKINYRKGNSVLISKAK